jgi:hypothetical protein
VQRLAIVLIFRTSKGDLLPCPLTTVCYGFRSRVGTKWGTGSDSPLVVQLCAASDPAFCSHPE